MNREILNGPLEVGLRALAILSTAFPRTYDIASLVFIDYTMLHSSEFGGPASLNPDVPNHRSEIAIKRDLLEHGLEVMIRAKLIKLCVDAHGIGYSATENAPGFVDLLESEYMQGLRDRADWVISMFGDTEAASLRDEFRRLAGWLPGETTNYPLGPSSREED